MLPPRKRMRAIDASECVVTVREREVPKQRTTSRCGLRRNKLGYPDYARRRARALRSRRERAGLSRRLGTS